MNPKRANIPTHYVNVCRIAITTVGALMFREDYKIRITEQNVDLVFPRENKTFNHVRYITIDNLRNMSRKLNSASYNTLTRFFSRFALRLGFCKSQRIVALYRSQGRGTGVELSVNAESVMLLIIIIPVAAEMSYYASACAG